MNDKNTDTITRECFKALRQSYDLTEVEITAIAAFCKLPRKTREALFDLLVGMEEPLSKHLEERKWDKELVEQIEMEGRTNGHIVCYEWACFRLRHGEPLYDYSRLKLRK